MSDSPQSQSKARRDKLVGTVHVGDRSRLSEVRTMRCIFHDFESLPNEVGDEVCSEPMRVHGHLWYLKLNPGGETESARDHVSLFLCVKPDNKDDEVFASYWLRFPGDSNSSWGGSEKECFTRDSGWGYENFLLREDVLDSDENYLEDGDLTIEVDIQVWTKDPKCWSPPIDSTYQSDMLHVLEAKQFADVTFVVQGKKFPAHRNVLASRAPVLAAFFEDEPPNSEIELSDSIDPTIFELLLVFVYANRLPPSDDLKDQPREILCAANFCGLIAPKLAAESVLIESVSADTAAELLAFADANSCALLKEVAIDFFVANAAAVRASAGWANVKESKDLMDELMEAMLSGKRDPSEEVDADRMCVATLRRKLGESGLDVDGSRASLVKRLKKRSSGKRLRKRRGYRVD